MRIATGASMVGKHCMLGLLRYWENPKMLQWAPKLWHNNTEKLHLHLHYSSSLLLLHPSFLRYLFSLPPIFYFFLPFSSCFFPLLFFLFFFISNSHSFVIPFTTSSSSSFSFSSNFWWVSNLSTVLYLRRPQRPQILIWFCTFLFRHYFKSLLSILYCTNKGYYYCLYSLQFIYESYLLCY
jgi:hypothetical protein